jgi:hypothetical protein
LLLNKNFSPVILILFLLLVVSCGEKKETAPVKDYQSPEALLSEAKTLLGDDVILAYSGSFYKGEDETVAVGSEISTKETWGIKFFLLKKDDNGYEKIYETEILDGSFRNSAVEKLNLPSSDYELLYYNSLDYFVGSGGGEVFSYIIDFNKQEVYYAHLVTEGKEISLFLSGNINDDEIKNFFLDVFRKDYPAFSLADEDIKPDN